MGAFWASRDLGVVLVGRCDFYLLRGDEIRHVEYPAERHDVFGHDKFNEIFGGC